MRSEKLPSIFFGDVFGNFGCRSVLETSVGDFDRLDVKGVFRWLVSIYILMVLVVCGNFFLVNEEIFGCLLVLETPVGWFGGNFFYVECLFQM